MTPRLNLKAADATDPKHNYSLRIYNGIVPVTIDGVLFVAFEQLAFKGVYAYKDGTDLYVCDIYLAETTMEVYFKTRGAWVSFLKLLDEKL